MYPAGTCMQATDTCPMLVRVSPGFLQRMIRKFRVPTLLRPFEGTLP